MTPEESDKELVKVNLLLAFEAVQFGHNKQPLRAPAQLQRVHQAPWRRWEQQAEVHGSYRVQPRPRESQMCPAPVTKQSAS